MPPLDHAPSPTGHTSSASKPDDPEYQNDFSKRQNTVLAVALRILVDGGDKALTTAGLAKAANCSKESLYKWFGDRDGLLEAVVTYQASKVRAVDERVSPSSPDAFQAALTAFAEDLLDVLLSDTSLALNRLSIGAVRGGEAGLGAVLLDKGKRRIEARATHLLRHGRRRGFIKFGDPGTTYATLYGLIIGDTHIRALLGDNPKRPQADRRDRASRAIDQFLSLHTPSNPEER